ncbi:hypothetical protein OFM39_30045, partial [Escherichia coli]|nr:hypothetical protein [Escherichia coli]
ERTLVGRIVVEATSQRNRANPRGHSVVGLWMTTMNKFRWKILIFPNGHCIAEEEGVILTESCSSEHGIGILRLPFLFYFLD